MGGRAIEHGWTSLAAKSKGKCQVSSRTLRALYTFLMMLHHVLRCGRPDVDVDGSEKGGRASEGSAANRQPPDSGDLRQGAAARRSPLWELSRAV